MRNQNYFCSNLIKLISVMLMVLFKWWLFSCSVIFNSMWLNGLQHARLPCPSLSPRVCSNFHPLSQWSHTVISSSVTPFSSCPQSFPASGSFPRVGFLHQVAKVLELQLQHQYFQRTFRIDFHRKNHSLDKTDLCWESNVSAFEYAI